MRKQFMTRGRGWFAFFKDYIYFPYLKYEIKLELPKDIFQQQLEDITDEKLSPFYLYYTGKKIFRGKIHHTSFLINRIINYRNSFLPVIEGDFDQNSIVKIKMRLNWLVFCFWIFWMILTTLPYFEIILTLDLTSKNDLVLLFLPIFGYFICIVPFNFEVAKAKKILEGIAKQR